MDSMSSEASLRWSDNIYNIYQSKYAKENVKKLTTFKKILNPPIQFCYKKGIGEWIIVECWVDNLDESLDELMNRIRYLDNICYSQKRVKGIEVILPEDVVCPVILRKIKPLLNGNLEIIHLPYVPPPHPPSPSPWPVPKPGPTPTPPPTPMPIRPGPPAPEPQPKKPKPPGKDEWNIYPPRGDGNCKPNFLIDLNLTMDGREYTCEWLQHFVQNIQKSKGEFTLDDYENFANDAIYPTLSNALRLIQTCRWETSKEYPNGLARNILVRIPQCFIEYTGENYPLRLEGFKKFLAELNMMHQNRDIDYYDWEFRNY